MAPPEGSLYTITVWRSSYTDRPPPHPPGFNDDTLTLVY